MNNTTRLVKIFDDVSTKNTVKLEEYINTWLKTNELYEVKQIVGLGQGQETRLLIFYVVHAKPLTDLKY